MPDPSVVLNFHGIGAPERPLEPGEAPYWVGADRYAAILDRIGDHPGRDRIRITFDDGNRSDRTIALAPLVERGLRADFFVLTGRLGRPGSLDEGDVRALLAAGMGVGSHGIDHVDWRRLPPEALARELGESRAVLEALCGRPVTEAGIPFGHYNRRVLRALREAGYRVAYSSDRGPMRERDFPRPRTSVRSDWDLATVDAVLSGRLPALRRVRRAVGMALRRWGP